MSRAGFGPPRVTGVVEQGAVPWSAARPRVAISDDGKADAVRWCRRQAAPFSGVGRNDLSRQLPRLEGPFRIPPHISPLFGILEAAAQGVPHAGKNEIAAAQRRPKLPNLHASSWSKYLPSRVRSTYRLATLSISSLGVSRGSSATTPVFCGAVVAAVPAAVDAIEACAAACAAATVAVECIVARSNLSLVVAPATSRVCAGSWCAVRHVRDFPPSFQMSSIGRRVGRSVSQDVVVFRLWRQLVRSFTWCRYGFVCSLLRS